MSLKLEFLVDLGFWVVELLIFVVVDFGILWFGVFWNVN